MGRGKSSFRRKFAIGIGIGGGTVVSLGIVLGLRANGLERDANRLCTMATCEQADEGNSLIERGKMSATYANISYAAGAAALLGAAALWFAGSSSKKLHQGIVLPSMSSTSIGVHEVLVHAPMSGSKDNVGFALRLPCRRALSEARWR